MDQIQLTKLMRANGIDLLDADTLDAKRIAFGRALRLVIKPRNQSDRTSFRKIERWLVENCESGVFDYENIFRRVLDFALEASGPESRNPAAVFTHILKKELNYG